ncbi:MAG: hypothetical protein OEY10_00055 [Nitrosopumilus sp.]|nr:hypothetical protein [Nitrosopumilus sp.]
MKTKKEVSDKIDELKEYIEKGMILQDDMLKRGHYTTSAALRNSCKVKLEQFKALSWVLDMTEWKEDGNKIGLRR